MKLSKAIEILTKWKEPESMDESEELYKARELLIEAGKRVLNSRVEPRYSSVDPLPGETEE